MPHLYNRFSPDTYLSKLADSDCATGAGNWETSCASTAKISLVLDKLSPPANKEDKL